ncbi:MAG: transcription elongation factor GreA [Clostridiales bacterium]|nr:transcription elongation factor GreA [Clostridiales bacterium]
MGKQITVTETGLKKLQQDLDYLKNVKRKEVAEKIGIARGFGDLSENSEYDAAKNEQNKIETQIHELEEMISNAKVISEDQIDVEKVNIGVTVKVHDYDLDEDDEYTLVSSREVDLSKNMISDQSAIGKSLVGSKIGDVVSVVVPDGSELKFKILDIYKKD